FRSACLAASTLAFPIVVEPAPWMALRAIVGYCTCAAFMVIESWLAGGTPKESRGVVFATYMIVNKGMFGVGQLLLLVADPAGDRLFMLSAMLYALCLVPLALTRRADPAHLGTGRLPLMELWRLSPISVTGAATAGVVNSSLLGLMPVYGVQIGLTVAEISYVMTALLGGSLFLQLPIGRLSDRFDRRAVLLGVTLVTMATSAAVSLFVGAGMAGLIALSLIVGGLTSTVYPIALSHANDVTPVEQTVALVAGLTLAFSIGSISGPPVIAALMERVHPEALFHAVAVANLLLAAFTGFRMTRRARPPEAQTAPFVPQPQTQQATPAVAALDSRSQGPGLDR
ncbi:MAG: MFS transporter, partial [Alphaproteobacteria bacterium]